MDGEKLGQATSDGVDLPPEIDRLARIKTEIRKVLIGQDQLVERLLIGLICNQHVLIEGVPGLAKTLSVTTLAKTLGLLFRRVQFTPDLLPADILGTLIYNPKTGDFTPRKGPIFGNLILADEINRAPAKVQSALLESMQERQVTIGDNSYRLDEPFMVLATQNPIEQEGTYPLPEAQVDRFMLKVKIDYPDKTEEIAILRRMAKSAPPQEVDSVATAADIIALRVFLDNIYLDPAIEEYVVDIVHATRDPERYGIGAGDLIRYGGSPRATIFLTMAAKAKALLSGRTFVIPADVQEMAPDILRHRVIVSYEAEAESLSSDDVITRILEALPEP